MASSLADVACERHLRGPGDPRRHDPTAFVNLRLVEVHKAPRSPGPDENTWDTPPDIADENPLGAWNRAPSANVRTNVRERPPKARNER
jgi:hypothetical protein